MKVLTNISNNTIIYTLLLLAHSALHGGRGAVTTYQGH